MLGEVPKRTKQQFSTTAFITRRLCCRRKGFGALYGGVGGSGLRGPVQADAEHVCGQEHGPAVASKTMK